MDLDVMVSAAAALRGMRARKRWQRSELDAYRARQLGKLPGLRLPAFSVCRDFHAGVARAGGQVRVHPAVIHQVMDTAPAAAWQLIQQPGRLRVLVAGTRPSFDPQVMTAGLHQALMMRQAAVPAIVVEHVTAIPRGRSGKAPLIGPLPQHDHVTT